MVHYPNARIDIAVLSVTTNDEGTRIKEYDFTTPIDSFEADVQPNVLTKEQIDLYGINEKTAHTKKAFYTRSSFMLAGNRAELHIMMEGLNIIISARRMFGVIAKHFLVPG